MSRVPTIIVENPFRVLGLFSNSSSREQTSNTVKISRYSSVGKEVSFPTDLSFVLGGVSRSTESVNDAARMIQLNSDRISYALFWMMKNDSSQQEVDALNHLCHGEFDKALDELDYLSTPTAYINRAFIHLLKGSIKESASCAWRIISDDRNRKEFLKAACGELFSMEKEELASRYLDLMVAQYSVQEVYRAIMREPGLSEISEMLSKKLGKGIEDSISAKVASAKADNNTSEEWCAAAITLIDETHDSLNELEEVTLGGGLEGRIYADKVANQALQCVINAYNLAFEQIAQDNGASLKSIIPTCLEIINRLDTSKLSPVVIERIKSNKEGIEKIAKEGVQNLVMYAIANDTSKCFFCGAKANGTRTFEFKREERRRVSYNKERVTTYTKGVKIPICPDCDEAFEKKDKWKSWTMMISTGLAFVALAVLVFINSDLDAGSIIGAIIGLIFLGIGVSALVGLIISSIFSRPLQWIFDRKSIRKFTRQLNDHPAVKQVKKEGFS